MLEYYQIVGAELTKIKISQSKKGTFKKNGQRKYLSKDEVKEIINLYPDYFNWQLERIFNVHQSTILNIRRKYNLHKSVEVMKKCKFGKGCIPHNKNKSHNYPNTGMFTKGHTPENHKSVGIIRETHKYNKLEYLEIKITEPNKWQLLHRYIWEKNYGVIPKGGIIIFQDKNRLNYDISNLELITRKENLQRNINRKKASRSLKKTWRKKKLREKYGLLAFDN